MLKGLKNESYNEAVLNPASLLLGRILPVVYKDS